MIMIHRTFMVAVVASCVLVSLPVNGFQPVVATRTRLEPDCGYGQPLTTENISPRRSVRNHVSFSPQVEESLPVITNDEHVGSLEATVRKIGMILYIASMCLALPMALAPTILLSQCQLMSKTECEQQSLQIGEACARGLLQLIPFLDMKVTSHHQDDERSPEPSIWVCNHTSMLDVFILLASDEQLRGKDKRPIKAVYWKGLDENPITKLLFHMCGFIPVQMADNGSGNDNEYDRSSFKSMLKETKKAFEEGFDVLVLPEGQLNPHPEEGLLPVFPGAYTLSRMSHRPIRMVALYGVNHFWDETVGMKVTSRQVAVRAYPPLQHTFQSPTEFVTTFKAVVGHFGASGHDLPPEELHAWLDGSAWNEQQTRDYEQANE